MSLSNRSAVGVGLIVVAAVVAAWRINPQHPMVDGLTGNPIELLADPSFEFGGDAWHVGSDAAYRQVRITKQAQHGSRAVTLAPDEVVFQSVGIGTHRGLATRGSVWVRDGGAELHVRTDCGPGKPFEETVTRIPSAAEWHAGSATLTPQQEGCSLRIELASRGNVTVDDFSLVDPRLADASFESASTSWKGNVTGVRSSDAFDGERVGRLGAGRIFQQYRLDPSMEEYVADVRVHVRRGAGAADVVVRCPGQPDRAITPVRFPRTDNWAEATIGFRETTARIEPGADGCVLDVGVTAAEGTELDGALLELRTGPTTNGGGESHVGDDEAERTVPPDAGGVANLPTPTTVPGR